MLALMVFGIARCASAEFCPDDKALISAVRSRDDSMVLAISAQAAEEDPGSLTMVSSQRIMGVSDVICDEVQPGEFPTIMCKFTVRYWSTNSYLVARLVKKDGAWEIGESLQVNRKRR